MKNILKIIYEKQDEGKQELGKLVQELRHFYNAENQRSTSKCKEGIEEPKLQLVIETEINWIKW